MSSEREVAYTPLLIGADNVESFVDPLMVRVRGNYYVLLSPIVEYKKYKESGVVPLLFDGKLGDLVNTNVLLFYSMFSESVIESMKSSYGVEIKLFSEKVHIQDPVFYLRWFGPLGLGFHSEAGWIRGKLLKLFGGSTHVKFRLYPFDYVFAYSIVRGGKDCWVGSHDYYNPPFGKKDYGCFASQLRSHGVVREWDKEFVLLMMVDGLLSSWVDGVNMPTLLYDYQKMNFDKGYYSRLWLYHGNYFSVFDWVLFNKRVTLVMSAFDGKVHYYGNVDYGVLKRALTMDYLNGDEGSDCFWFDTSRPLVLFGDDVELCVGNDRVYRREGGHNSRERMYYLNHSLVGSYVNALGVTPKRVSKEYFYNGLLKRIVEGVMSSTV